MINEIIFFEKIKLPHVLGQSQLGIMCCGWHFQGTINGSYCPHV